MRHLLRALKAGLTTLCLRRDALEVCAFCQGVVVAKDAGEQQQYGRQHPESRYPGRLQSGACHGFLSGAG